MKAIFTRYFLVTLEKNETNNTFCPIIIDSPNQQDQDHENLKKMIKLILDEQPKNSQLILGVVSLEGIHVDGTIIELKNKYSLLQEDEYEDVSSILGKLLQYVK